MNRFIVHCLASLMFLLAAIETFSQTFTDVTVDAGIVLSASMGNTVVWLDYDNDGWLDFYGNTNEFAFFYKNNGNGTFTDITTSTGLSDTDPASVAVADFDKDGYVDLLIVPINISLPMRIYKNMSGNNFQIVFEGQSGIERAIWLDFEGDGDLDIFCNTGGFPLLYLNDGESNFTESAAGMDFNNNSGITSAAADMNNDGFTDIYTCIYGSANRLYKNIAGGNVEDISFSAHVADYNKGVSQSWGDYDNDGFLDLYVSNIQSNRNILYKNLGDETFLDVTYDADVADAGDARTSAWIDFNNDGLMDLFTTNHINENRLYQNNGDGTFTDVAEEWNIRNPEDGFGISWGDYDLDGDQDVLICGHNNTMRLLRNDGNNLGNYLDIELKGVFDNASGIGTRIVVYVDGQMTVQEINGGRGARCQDALIAHFGLAAATQADSLIVKWQSGMVQKLYGVSANQLITIVQSAVGVNDKSSEKELLELYPNPAQDVIYLSFEKRMNTSVKVKIYSITGQVVLSRSMKSQGSASIDVMGLTRGWYYIMINCEHGVFYRPFIKE